jgi:hypothetical protein
VSNVQRDAVIAAETMHSRRNDARAFVARAVSAAHAYRLRAQDIWDYSLLPLWTCKVLTYNRMAVNFSTKIK